MQIHGVDETGCKNPVLDWTNGELDDGSFNQAKNLANLPFIHRHVALMPDAHQGYGMPIGGVAGFKDVISPYCVGNDIGCGMRLVETNLKASELDHRSLVKLRNEIKKVIPIGGGNVFQKEQEWIGFEDFCSVVSPAGNRWDFPEWCSEANLKWFTRSLGTLGGGNHFVEFQKDDKDTLYIMIHSGSRNLGAKVCGHYHNIAADLCKRWHIKLPDAHLAYLPTGTKEADQYLRDMNFALSFARENRRRMMEKVVALVCLEVGKLAKVTEEYDVHHNYAALENHMGSNVWVHRKGATSARLGEIGIIPGSQGSKSYIVVGRGDSRSFMSCSHGAGRLMGREDAKRRLNFEDERKKLDDKGIVHTLIKPKNLDEADSAYKDISIVMANQADLVKISVELSPLMSVKG